MHIDIIPIGNSKGIRIPKALLEQCGMSGRVELTIKNKSMLLKPVTEVVKARNTKARKGWAAAAKRMAKNGDDKLLDEWPPTKFDKEEWEW